MGGLFGTFTIHFHKHNWPFGQMTIQWDKWPSTLAQKTVDYNDTPDHISGQFRIMAVSFEWFCALRRLMIFACMSVSISWDSDFNYVLTVFVSAYSNFICPCWSFLFDRLQVYFITIEELFQIFLMVFMSYFIPVSCARTRSYRTVRPDIMVSRTRRTFPKFIRQIRI